jgi:hypothetical protein
MQIDWGHFGSLPYGHTNRKLYVLAVLEAYLSKLIDEVPLAVNALHYAKIIHDKATLRSLIERGYAIIKRCWADQSQVDDVVDFAESCFFEVSERKVRPSFHSVRDLVVSSFDAIESRRENEGLPTGVPTGFFKLDKLTAGFQKSDLIILAARPSIGKTAFALNIARNVAVECQIPVGFFSLEMSKEQLVMRLLCSEARIDSIRLCNDLEQKSHAPISQGELAGGIFPTSKKFLNAFGGFKKPTNEEWNIIEGIYDVRNVLIHGGGYISKSKLGSKRKLNLLVRKNAGITITDSDYLRISSKFCEFALSNIWDFFVSFYKELEINFESLRLVRTVKDDNDDRENGN